MTVLKVMLMSNHERAQEGLGEPQISFSGFQVWIHERQFEDLQDYWDGNWLRVTVHVGGAGADVWAQGSILHLGELEDWLRQLELMSKTMSGKAELAPMEPNLYARFEIDKLGHISTQIYITPDHMSQHHEFQEEIDQSYLPGLIRQLRTVLQDYPIRGNRPRERQPSDLKSKDGRLGQLWSRWNWLGIRLWR
jgi:hypothetical protein